MTIKSGHKKNYWMLTPVFGILIFIVLYIIGTLLYPGGSQVDKNAIGFSWINNYWCNMLNEDAINGQHNPARPVAMAAMFIVCAALTFFWYLFPRQVNFARFSRLSVQLAGTISMTVTLLLFSKLHDAVISIATLFGCIALLGTFIGLFKIKSYKLFGFGFLNIFFIALNNYVYYTKGLIIYLPVVQKISFLYFLLWLCCVNICLYRKTRFLINIGSG